MDHLADRLDQAADSLTALSREIPALARASDASVAPALPLAAALPAAPGLPGRFGRDLHDRWAAVLEARSREAAAAGVRLAEAARSVRTTRRQYAETDEAVERRLIQEL